jgi:hypothetical protein
MVSEMTRLFSESLSEESGFSEVGSSTTSA